MKRALKKVLVFPIYMIYLIVIDWILGIGTKDIWDKLKEWSKK